MEGLDDFDETDFLTAMSLDRDDWEREILSHDELFIKLNDRIPKEMLAIRDLTCRRCGAHPSTGR
jgi:phosphoenolpyruvate carboxykinase (GTP)